jgi:hypothetical protein
MRFRRRLFVGFWPGRRGRERGVGVVLLWQVRDRALAAPALRPGLEAPGQASRPQASACQALGWAEPRSSAALARPLRRRWRSHGERRQVHHDRGRRSIRRGLGLARVEGSPGGGEMDRRHDDATSGARAFVVLDPEHRVALLLAASNNALSILEEIQIRSDSNWRLTRAVSSRVESLGVLPKALEI